MPMYEYTCNHCAQEFEELVSGNQVVSCPACGSKKVVRKLSTFAPISGKMVKKTAPGSTGTCTTGCCPF
ncbi:MAG: zinc ribbon domain-containing protein [Sedimentisphaerales bacterium]|nr:zinc ribbon domain-containing protein [Sedimentisphaerales bacterium]